jgi:hypothetical protein
VFSLKKEARKMLSLITPLLFKEGSGVVTNLEGSGAYSPTFN